MPLAPSWVPQNMLGLDGQPLVVLVVDSDPSGTEETVADLVGVELDGGSYSRGTATGEATLIGDAWVLFATGVDPFDLSDSDARAGVWLATDGATDADRALIHYSPDPAAPDPAYTPTWPSGVYDLPVESIDGILEDLDDRVTVLENDPGGGGVPDPSGEDDGDVLTVSSGAAIWAPPSGGGGGAPDWGDIGGTLADQTDLADALGDKADTSSLAPVATTGDYDDLTGTPTIPSTPGEVGADPAGTALDLVSQITPASIGAAPASHAHAGEDITTGTVATARLDVGTTAGTVASGDHGHTAAAVGAVAAEGDAVALWLGTETEYAAIGSPSPTTIYVVTEDP